jgi:hypothetical protein
MNYLGENAMTVTAADEILLAQLAESGDIAGLEALCRSLIDRINDLEDFALAHEVNIH